MALAETEALKKTLLDELTLAESKVKASSEAIGIEQTKEFMPKALRLKGRIIAEKELSDMQGAFDDAIEKLGNEATMLSTAEMVKFKNNLKRQLNAMSLALIEKTGLTQKEIAKMNLDEAQSAALISAIGGTAQGLAKGLVSSIGIEKKKPSDEWDIDFDLEKPSWLESERIPEGISGLPKYPFE